jgi:hypothetical protein
LHGLREGKHHKIRWTLGEKKPSTEAFINKPLYPSEPVRQAAEFPIGLYPHQLGFYRIPVNVRADELKIFRILDNPRKKPVSPQMSLSIMRFVPHFGEITFEPLHNLRQGNPVFGFDEKMDVIIHNREVPELKRKLLFGEDNQGKEGSLDIGVFQGHGIMVDFGGYVIGGPRA